MTLVQPVGVEVVAARLRDAEPAAAVRWALRAFEPGRVVVATGLQAEGVTVVDLALEVDPDVRVVTVDTGRLPEESQRYLDVLRARWGRDIEVLRPRPRRVVDFVSAHGPDAFYVDPSLRVECCAIRKAEPLAAVLAGVDCWITGQRRDQAATRGDVEVVEVDATHGGIVKVNPFAYWTQGEVRQLAGERAVPLHPLYVDGYSSIGCAPCTRATRPGEHERAGRWWWEEGVDAECGIHRLPVISLVERTA